jgi:hypothetical protein
MLIATVCEKMHWTYNEYLEQPNWIIQTLLIKWNIENEVANKQNKK